jgi:hypothetical protein
LFVYQYSGRAAFVNKQVVFVVNICRCEMKSFVYYAFCFSFFLTGGEREGPYPRGGIGYLWLARSFR